MKNNPVDAIEVNVASNYLPAESDPEQSRYTFSYTVTITNRGQRAARLMTRHWIIVDSSGKKQEVQGDGVVGEQPYLKPGEAFQYSSGTIIETPAGIMEGKYHMVTDSGERFTAEIPPFALAVPQMLH
ncbi:MAG TPA: Co2+/Mg2+ efflux protein ApaG [Gammaproteobacteria bacterium]|nr:Co2+/Mg2+ efflux protein ApaG [Gammaproteobacteria bacterium]